MILQDRRPRLSLFLRAQQELCYSATEGACSHPQTALKLPCKQPFIPAQKMASPEAENWQPSNLR